MTVDVRCAAELADPEIERADGRCQLYVGHEGAHALMSAGRGGRELWLWCGAQPVQIVPLDDGVPYQQPWAPSCPRTVSAATAATTPAAAGDRRRRLRSVA